MFILNKPDDKTKSPTELANFYFVQLCKYFENDLLKQNLNPTTREKCRQCALHTIDAWYNLLRILMPPTNILNENMKGLIEKTNDQNYKDFLIGIETILSNLAANTLYENTKELLKKIPKVVNYLTQILKKYHYLQNLTLLCKLDYLHVYDKNLHSTINVDTIQNKTTHYRPKAFANITEAYVDVQKSEPLNKYKLENIRLNKINQLVRNNHYQLNAWILYFQLYIREHVKIATYQNNKRKHKYYIHYSNSNEIYKLFNDVFLKGEFSIKEKAQANYEIAFYLSHNFQLYKFARNFLEYALINKGSYQIRACMLAYEIYRRDVNQNGDLAMLNTHDFAIKQLCNLHSIAINAVVNDELKAYFSGKTAELIDDNPWIKDKPKHVEDALQIALKLHSSHQASAYILLCLTHFNAKQYILSLNIYHKIQQQFPDAAIEMEDDFKRDCYEHGCTTIEDCKKGIEFAKISDDPDLEKMMLKKIQKLKSFEQDFQPPKGLSF